MRCCVVLVFGILFSRFFAIFQYFERFVGGVLQILALGLLRSKFKSITRLTHCFRWSTFPNFLQLSYLEENKIKKLSINKSQGLATFELIMATYMGKLAVVEWNQYVSCLKIYYVPLFTASQCKQRQKCVVI